MSQRDIELPNPNGQLQTAPSWCVRDMDGNLLEGQPNHLTRHTRPLVTYRQVRRQTEARKERAKRRRKNLK